MKRKIQIHFIFICLIIFSINNTASSQDSSEAVSGIAMAKLMADSEMQHFPECSLVDGKKESWNYTSGLVSLAMIKMWEQTGDKKYYDYAKGYADKFITSDGEIRGYKKSDFNVDKINSGKFIFTLLEQTNNQKYKKAIYILRNQLKDHPRTSEGGFWHKQRYPSQMWLDGLYMEAPFYAQFAQVFNEPKAFDDVVNQFIVANKYTFNPESGLNYHAWDESKKQKWADPVTGCSKHFWGRAMGWYAMALVDVLDFIPTDHPKREEIIKILNQVASGIKKHQDVKSGVWYQVLDLSERKGNYLESSASSMFVYTLLKASRLNYIDKKFVEVAQRGYRGILKEFIQKNENNTISLTRTCAVAGLGGDPYRSGDFDYYINEKIRDNDPKGVGPFIMASLEYEKINH